MESPPCLLCHCKQTHLYWDRVWHATDSRVYACSNCRLLFLWPRMTSDQTREYYVNYGAHLVQRGVISAKETETEGADRCNRLQQYRHERLLPYFEKPVSVLEIGGGYCNFLGKLIEKGMVNEAVVVESSPERLAFVTGRYGISGYEQLEQVRGRRFDVILMFHVLEHVDRPMEFLSQCDDLLHPGGRMVIEVPSSTDPLLSIYDCKAYKNFYFQPMHPAVYSQPALEYGMSRCGLTAQTWLYEQRYGLANHLHWLLFGTPGGDPALERFIGEALDAQYKARLRQQQQTDTIIGLFTKPVTRM